MSVKNKQRFLTEHSPCPICGGYDRMQRGYGERCTGFLSDDGKYALCTREERAGQLDITNSEPPGYVHLLKGKCKCGTTHKPDAERERQTTRNNKPYTRKSKSTGYAFAYDDARATAHYHYRNEQEQRLYTVVRYQWENSGKPGGYEKTFRQFHYEGAEPIATLGDVRRVLYRLPELIKADTNEPVYIPEGEKDVDTLARLGLVATCNVGGAAKGGTHNKKWVPEYTRFLKGRHIVILPDNDSDGESHAETLVKHLIGNAASIKVVLLPELPEKGDTTDWIESGHTKAELERIVQETPTIEEIAQQKHEQATSGQHDEQEAPPEDPEHSFDTSDEVKLATAIRTKDVELLLECVPYLAELPTIKYISLELKIKQAFAKLINFTHFAAALSEVKKKKQASSKQTSDSGYQAHDDGMAFTSDRGDVVMISNFTAEILSDVTSDDGAERVRSYEIAAHLKGRRSVFEVRAKDFAACNWIDEYLGAHSRVTTGQSMRSHLINAIKACSEPEEHFNYAHTGWRSIDGIMGYLHNDGFVSQVSQVKMKDCSYLTQDFHFYQSASEARSGSAEDDISQVSQVSQVNNIRVKLSEKLSRYCFPSSDCDINTAIRASLQYLNLTKDTITVPLYCCVWRAVLPSVDFSVHLAGQSGRGKTELVTLLQQHFGPLMDAKHLPGSWESTDNALEMQLFQAKDTLMVVDDFKPRGSKIDQDRLHAKADRIFRQIGNGSAKGRLTPTLDARPERRPRCLMLSTGEDIPRGQSLKARGIILVMEDAVTIGEPAYRLTLAQKDARAGLYAYAVRCFLEWLAPQMDAIQSQLPEMIEAERERISVRGHARTGTTIINLLIGMKFFLRFACECGAISEQEAKQFLTRCMAALREIASDAAVENSNDKPSEQWRRLLVAALTSKSAHLVSASGDNPGLEYGWQKSVRQVERDGMIDSEETVRGGGVQIGWIDGEDIYLIPSAAYKAAYAMGSATSDMITTLEPTLRKFLVQDKMLASTSLNLEKRKTITVRRRLQNMQQDVLHIKASLLFPEVESEDTPPSDSSPIHETVDSLDLHDSVVSERASEAVEALSQVDDSKSSESSSEHDSEGIPDTIFAYESSHISNNLSADDKFELVKKHTQALHVGQSVEAAGIGWVTVDYVGTNMVKASRFATPYEFYGDRILELKVKSA